MSEPRILHVRDAHPEAVRIHRPTKWGNPFVIGKDGNREKVLREYAMWFFSQDHLMNSLHELRGKDLVCYCAPEACHGDLLLYLANETVFGARQHLRKELQNPREALMELVVSISDTWSKDSEAFMWTIKRLTRWARRRVRR